MIKNKNNNLINNQRKINENGTARTTSSSIDSRKWSTLPLKWSVLVAGNWFRQLSSTSIWLIRRTAKKIQILQDLTMALRLYSAEISTKTLTASFSTTLVKNMLESKTHRSKITTTSMIVKLEVMVLKNAKGLTLQVQSQRLPIPTKIYKNSTNRLWPSLNTKLILLTVKIKKFRKSSNSKLTIRTWSTVSVMINRDNTFKLIDLNYN